MYQYLDNGFILALVASGAVFAFMVLTLALRVMQRVSTKRIVTSLMVSWTVCMVGIAWQVWDYEPTVYVMPTPIPTSTPIAYEDMEYGFIYPTPTPTPIPPFVPTVIPYQSK